jgi:dCMP deaminase
MPRPDWDVYFMQMAHLVATRATCPRRHVGAIVVKDKHVLSGGYNGSLPGLPHCDDIGCLIEGTSGCQRTIHAEMNAIAQAARHGISLSGSIIYVTTFPCMSCFKSIIAVGIIEVIYGSEYREDVGLGLAQLAGVKVRKYDDAGTSNREGG